jgi:hypothetical protein
MKIWENHDQRRAKAQGCSWIAEINHLSVTKTAGATFIIVF